MKSKCCQQEQSGELKVKVVKADGVEGTRCNVEVTDFEKLDQKLDIMLGDVAYTGNKTINRVSSWLDKLTCLIKGHRYWEIDCILVCSRCGKKEV